MKYHRREIVLAQFPFTDGTGKKLRPILILVESSRLHSDYLAMFISSQLSQKEEHDIVIDPAKKEFASSGLSKPSLMKLLKLGTISESLILGTLGELSKSEFVKIVSSLVQLLQAS
ncbi:MAG: type II toxin-antitoxin system PemK/MazF family toxin [Bacteroidota bacterium]|nr:type II toxin-antitoxin system PemK/MazF family toxin [Bacteroidota bacterium]